MRNSDPPGQIRTTPTLIFGQWGLSPSGWLFADEAATTFGKTGSGVASLGWRGLRPSRRRLTIHLQDNER